MVKHILEATAVRSDMRMTIEKKGWFTKSINQNTAAFILGLPVDALKHMSILVQPDAVNGFTISAGSKRMIAMQAFQSWANSRDSGAKESFNKESYLILYGIFEQAAQGLGKKAFTEAATLFTQTIIMKSPSWKPFIEYARGGSIADEGDYKIIKMKMKKLWSKIPPGIQREMAQYDPENLFKN